MSKDRIELTIDDISPAAIYLQELIGPGMNQPEFTGPAKLLFWRLLPEMQKLPKLSAEELNALKDTKIDFGPRIPAPQNYPDDFIPILNKICKGEIKKHESKLAELAAKNKKK